MTTGKLFKHGGSQAVRLPKAFRFEGTEVIIEKQGDAVVLKPKRRPKFKSLNEVARYLAKKYLALPNLKLDKDARSPPKQNSPTETTRNVLCAIIPYRWLRALRPRRV